MDERVTTEDDRIVRRIEWTVPRALVVALAAATTAIHAYVGLTTGEVRFFVLAVGLLSGAVIFFTRFWAPVLYLVGAIYVTVLLTVWVLAGTPRAVLGAIDAIVQIALVATFLYLFGENLRLEAEEGS